MSKKEKEEVVNKNKKEKIKEKNSKTKKEKTKKDKNKKKDKTPKENYFVGVKTEMSKVKWPEKKEVIKYTVSTILFIIVLVAFFLIMSLIMSAIKGAFR